MDMDVNTMLIILGGITLILIIGHGIWSNRQNQTKVFNQKEDKTLPNQFTEKAPAPVEKKSEEKPQVVEKISEDKKQEFIEKKAEPSIKEKNNVSHQEIKTIATNLNENEYKNIKITLRARDVYSLTIDEIGEAITTNEIPSEAVEEPKITLTQPLIQKETEVLFKDALVKNTTQKNLISENTRKEDVEEREVPQEECLDIEQTSQPQETSETHEQKKVIMLYIVAPEKEDFTGEKLQETLDKEGFLWGDKQIYHRHSEFTQQSPVLFSLANLENGGVFPEHTNYQTFGMALFMEIPVNYGTNLTNYYLMINTAKALARSLNATLLTETQTLFDETAEKAYRDRIIQ